MLLLGRGIVQPHECGAGNSQIVLRAGRRTVVSDSGVTQVGVAAPLKVTVWDG